MPTNGSCSKFKKLMKKEYLSGKYQSRRIRSDFGFLSHSLKRVAHASRLRSFSSRKPEARATFKDFRNFQNCVPTAVCSWNTKQFLDFAEVTDCLPFAAIHAYDEFVL